jgi:hypothetical protein
MKVISKRLNCSGVQRVEITENGLILIDGVTASSPVLIEAQTYTGFFSLEDLKPMFKHMKCWKERNGEKCGTCPVHHDGVCGIMGIKDASEKEAIEKSGAVRLLR